MARLDPEVSPDYGFKYGAPVDEPMSRIELALSAVDLKRQDVLSASDPFCVVKMQRGSNGAFFEVGRTDTVRNEKSPVWLRKILVDYYFEERCTLEFSVYDRDSKSEDLTKHDFVGRVVCSVAQAVGSAMQAELKLNLVDQSSRPAGTLVLRAEEANTTNNFVTLQFAGKKLDKKDGWFFGGKSDPYLVISRVSGSTDVLVHKTEVARKTVNPEWRPISLPVQLLCNNDYERLLKFKIWDKDKSSNDDLIGEFTTTLKALSEGPTSPHNVFECINPAKKARKSSYKNSGVVRLTSFKLETRPTFLEYLGSGAVRLNCSFAIDFTLSNGNPTDPKSLHFRNADGWNNYVLAIRSVGDIIQDYDADKQYPALGFGGKLPDGRVSFEFFLNGRTDSPYCSGIDMVIQAYYQALNTVQLYGPTNFAPVIDHVARFASAHKTTGDYFVLLIVTDGIITDFELTKAAIVRASYLPMSIIIIGVGDEDFSAMEALDCDGKLLRTSGGYGQVASRDIVQFVAFNEILRRHGIRDYREVFSAPALAAKSKDSLAKAVLAELPNQVVSYMSSNSITSHTPMTAPSS